MTGVDLSGRVRTRDGPGPDRMRPPVDPVWLLALAVAVVTFLAARVRVGPRVTDEVGYLLNARVLAGGPTGDLSCCTVYNGGYSLLLAPVALLWRDPEAFYQAVLAVNAVLVGLVVPAMYVLARHATGCPPAVARVAGVVAAAVPGLQIHSRYAWTEALLCLLVVVWLAAWAVALRRGAGVRGGGWAIPASSLVAAGLLTTHNRTLPIVLLQVCTLLLVARRFPRRRRAAGLGLGLLVAGSAAGLAVNSWLADRNWPDRDANDFVANAVDTVSSLDTLARMLTYTSGQLSYLAISTGTLTLAGVVLGLLGAVRGTPSARAVGLLLAGATAGIALLVGLVSGDVGDPAYWSYGRYAEIVSPAAVGLAVAWMAHRPRRGLIALVTAAALSWLVVLPVLERAVGPTVAPLNVVGLIATWKGGLVLDPVRSTLVATGVAVALGIVLGIASALARPFAAVALGAAAVGLSAASVLTFTDAVQQVDAEIRYPDRRTLADTDLPDAERVGVVVPPGGDGPWSMLLYFLPGQPVRLADGPPPGGVDVVLTAVDATGPPGWSDAGTTPDGAWRVWTRG